MKRPTNGVRVVLGFAVAAVLLVAPVVADGGDSPAEVMALAQANVKAEEWSKFAGLIAPSERSMAAFEVAMGVDMMSEFWEGENAKKLRSQYEEIVNRYGVADPPEQEDLDISNASEAEIEAHMQKRADLWFGKIDQAAFIGELMAAMTSMPEMAEQGPLLPEGELTDVVVDGDKATGMIGERKYEFVREGGRWYMASSSIGG